MPELFLLFVLCGCGHFQLASNECSRGNQLSGICRGCGEEAQDSMKIVAGKQTGWGKRKQLELCARDARDG